MAKRLLDTTARELAGYGRTDVLAAIRGSEGRVLAAEMMAPVMAAVYDVSNPELAAGMGADLLVLNLLDVREPAVFGIDAAPGDVVREVKRLTGRLVAVNLEPVDPAADRGHRRHLRPRLDGRPAGDPGEPRGRRELGVDAVVLTGNPGMGVTNASLARAVRHARTAGGEDLLLMAGRMHAAGSAEEAGGRIVDERDVVGLVEAGADVVLLPAPGTVPGLPRGARARLGRRRARRRRPDDDDDRHLAGGRGRRHDPADRAHGEDDRDRHPPPRRLRPVRRRAAGEPARVQHRDPRAPPRLPPDGDVDPALTFGRFTLPGADQTEVKSAGQAADPPGLRTRPGGRHGHHPRSTARRAVATSSPPRASRRAPRRTPPRDADRVPPRPRRAPSPSPDRGADRLRPPPTATPVDVTVYYLVDTRAGIRLARETRRGDRRRPRRRRGRADDRRPDRPRLLHRVGPGHPGARRDRAGGTVTVDLSEDARSASIGSEGAATMVQQLVWTVRGGRGDEAAGVLLTIAGEPAGELWGAVTWDDPVTRVDPLDVRQLVQIAVPAEGATSTSPVEVSGDAAAFEANVPWRVLDAAGAEVTRGFATTTRARCSRRSRSPSSSSPAPTRSRSARTTRPAARPARR